MPKLIPVFTMWFDVPDDPLGGRLEIRHLQGGEIRDIVAKSTDLRMVYRQDGVEKHSRHDLSADGDMALCRTVVAWEKFFGEDDQPLSCTDSNKRLFAKEEWFAEFVADCRRDVAEAFAKHQEKIAKN